MKESITDAINMMMDYRFDMIHTCLPGKILSYDEKERIANVEPLVSLKTSKEIDIKYQSIGNVPVVFPSGKVFSLRWDVSPGDGCLIVFSEAGIGNFLNSTENIQVSTDDSTRFSLTDAICIPGLFSIHQARALSKNNEIYIDKSGIISIKGKEIDLNGNTKSFVTHTELDTALQSFILSLNAQFAAKLDGGGSPGTLTLDISTSKTTTVKTGG